MHELGEIAPAFIAVAHRIVWATAATVSASGLPSTRILHPVWEWNGDELTGWIATSPLSPKAADLAVRPVMSLTYWDPAHDTCTARCDTTWETSEDELVAGWNRFKDAPPPVGYDPAIIPGWDSPTSPAFGILRLQPTRLRVMPASAMASTKDGVMKWRSP